MQDVCEYKDLILKENNLHEKIKLRILKSNSGTCSQKKMKLRFDAIPQDIWNN